MGELEFAYTCKAYILKYQRTFKESDINMTQAEKDDKMVEMYTDLKYIKRALLGADGEAGLVKEYAATKNELSSLKKEHEVCMARQKERKVDMKWVFVTALLVADLASKFWPSGNIPH